MAMYIIYIYIYICIMGLWFNVSGIHNTMLPWQVIINLFGIKSYIFNLTGSKIDAKINKFNIKQKKSEQKL
jgi:hypothetical protein